MSDQDKTVPEEEGDLKERVEKFSQEVQPLLGKYEIGIGAQAGLTPDGRVYANPVLLSTRKKPEAPAEARKPSGLAEA